MIRSTATALWASIVTASLALAGLSLPANAATSAPQSPVSAEPQILASASESAEAEHARLMTKVDQYSRYGVITVKDPRGTDSPYRRYEVHYFNDASNRAAGTYSLDSAANKGYAAFNNRYANPAYFVVGVKTTGKEVLGGGAFTSIDNLSASELAAIPTHRLDEGRWLEFNAQTGKVTEALAPIITLNFTKPAGSEALPDPAFYLLVPGTWGLKQQTYSTAHAYVGLAPGSTFSWQTPPTAHFAGQTAEGLPYKEVQLGTDDAYKNQIKLYEVPPSGNIAVPVTLVSRYIGTANIQLDFDIPSGLSGYPTSLEVTCYTSQGGNRSVMRVYDPKPRTPIKFNVEEDCRYTFQFTGETVTHHRLSARSDGQGYGYADAIAVTTGQTVRFAASPKRFPHALVHVDIYSPVSANQTQKYLYVYDDDASPLTVLYSRHSIGDRHSFLVPSEYLGKNLVPLASLNSTYLGNHFLATPYAQLPVNEQFRTPVSSESQHQYATLLRNAPKVKVKDGDNFTFPAIKIDGVSETRYLMRPQGTAAISGTVAAGATVKVSNVVYDPTPETVKYQWYANGTAIKGATKSSLKIPESVGAQKLKVRITASHGGFRTHTRDTKEYAVKAIKPRATRAPSISGKPTFGATLTASPGTWSNTGLTFTYQWYANGKAIKGATKRTYKAALATVGKRLTVKVTTRKTGVPSASALSSKTAKIAKAKPSVSTKLSRASIAKTTNAVLTIKIKAAGTSTPTGKLTVKVGSKSVTAHLKASHKGTVKVTLRGADLARGANQKVTVRYTPSGTTANVLTASATTPAGKLSVK